MKYPFLNHEFELIAFDSTLFWMQNSHHSTRTLQRLGTHGYRNKPKTLKHGILHLKFSPCRDVSLTSSRPWKMGIWPQRRLLSFGKPGWNLQGRTVKLPEGSCSLEFPTSGVAVTWKLCKTAGWKMDLKEDVFPDWKWGCSMEQVDLPESNTVTLYRCVVFLVWRCAF